MWKKQFRDLFFPQTVTNSYEKRVCLIFYIIHANNTVINFNLKLYLALRGQDALEKE